MNAQQLPFTSPKLGFPIDTDDEKVITNLSTVLVASIQEAKDRISHIEFLFCRKLYPHFHSKSKSLHKFYLDALKEKENELLLQIEKMKVENQRVVEENQMLKEKLERDLVDRKLRIEELEKEIVKKSEEIDEGLVLHRNLVDLVQSKEAMILKREGILKQYVEKNKGLIGRMKELEEEVEGFKIGMRKKDDKLEMLEAKNLELVCEIEGNEEESKRLLARIVELDEEALRRKLSGKMREEREKQLMMKQIDVLVKEKEVLLEGKVNGDSYQRVVKEVESLSSELQDEKRKRLHVTEAYKRLKSQHNYLREKMGLTSENMISLNRLEGESDMYKPKDPITAPGKI